MHSDAYGQLLQFLAPYPPDVQELALRGREKLVKIFAPISEIFYDAYSAVCLAVTYTGRVRDSFINLAVYSDHVTLIFQYGAFLDDPEGRLKGGGKQVRNIRLKGIETLRDPYVVGLMKQAAAQFSRPEGEYEPEQIVKVMKGPKRRPS